MRPHLSTVFRLLACERGSSLVGYSSLMLLVAIAAITLLARADAGSGSIPPQPAARATSSD